MIEEITKDLKAQECARCSPSTLGEVSAEEWEAYEKEQSERFTVKPVIAIEVGYQSVVIPIDKAKQLLASLTEALAPFQS